MITITEQYSTAAVYAGCLDPNVEGFLRALCASPLSQGSKIRIMPDVHPGKGCAVGTTMTLVDKAAPGLVGADIGCGMEVFQVSSRRRLELQKLDKLVHEKVPSGRKLRAAPHRFADQAGLDALRCIRHVQLKKAHCSIGTLGGGNHFIEMDSGSDGSYWLIIHSGSRHLGLEAAAWYQNEAFRRCPEGTPYELAWVSGELMEDYLHDMEIIQKFAALNRQAIADEIIRGMKLDVVETFRSVHNYIDLDTMILRKGAVSAQAGEKLIIPMNMRDGCLLCRGKGSEAWNFSAPHGAGRLMARSTARQSLTLSQYKKEMKGIYSTSVSRGTLDESPMAYKPMDMILSQIGPAVEVLERLRPIYNFKAGEE